MSYWDYDTYCGYSFKFLLDNFHLHLPKTFTNFGSVVRRIMVSHIPSLKSLTEVAKTE